MAFHELLNPLFNPLLEMGAFTTILIISIVVSLITTLIYKLLTDQKKLKQLKTETKSYQEKLKTLKDKPEKALKVQQEMMKVNMEYMKASFKPMFFTIIPLLLFFGWLGANLAYAPLQPDVSFDVTAIMNEDVQGQITLSLPEGLQNQTKLTQNVTKKVNWTLKGDTGEYDLNFKHEGSGEEQIVSLIITEEQKYIEPIHTIDSNKFKTIVVSHKKLEVFDGIFFFQNIPWIKGFGWLGGYILFSIIFSTLLRKLMKLA